MRRFLVYQAEFDRWDTDCFLKRTLTMMTPSTAIKSPMPSIKLMRSFKIIQDRTLIWMSMVLLMMLDSIALRVRMLWFQSQKAKAVLTDATYNITSHDFMSNLGKPCRLKPVPSSKVAPKNMLMPVTTKALCFWPRLA